MAVGDSGFPTRPENDIFTVLLAIATLFVLVATVYISVRAQALYGSWLPLGPGI